MALRALLVVVCCALCLSCNKKPDQTPAMPGDRITGSERIGWDQQAVDATELASFRYAIYVDGVRSELAGVTCTAAPPAFACTGRLPALTAGSHTLELASFIADVAVVESGKSAPLRITLGSVTSPSVAFDFSRTSDGRPIATELVADGLLEPTDLAFAPDGRLFIAERGGALRIVRNGRLEDGGIVDDVDTAGGGGLLGIALSPEFADTHHVYVVHTASGRDGELIFRVARYREVNGTLGERVVLLDGIPASSVDAHASLRFGPDRMLYVAFDDGGGRPDAYNGALLRFNADGTTPPDQTSPIIGQGFRSPRGLAWSPVDRRLWIADARDDGSELLSGGGMTYELPESAGGAALAFAGEGLMVVGEDSILQFHVSANPTRIDGADRLVGNAGLTPLRVVAVSPDGDVYFATETTLGRLAR